jgi:F-type H+-transporting ATPase subunit a
MASALLHIKDSYYFEVPKALWPASYGNKSQFPEVWVRLDPEFQLWEAHRLYDEYARIKENVPPEDEVISKYLEWKHANHANAGKPFDRFLEEHYDKAFFADHFASRGAQESWESAKEQAGDMAEFNADDSIRWSPGKIDAYNHHLSGKILIPQPFGTLRNFYERESGFAISKFMVIEVIVALLLWGIFSWLARQVEEGDRPRGKLWNLLEVFVVFIRDQIARPAIGGHDADRFVPLLLTFFFFILGCNLMGMLPWLGAPTGAFGATFGLACVTFATVIVFGMAKFGPLGFFKNQIPAMDLPFAMAVVLKPAILFVELLGLCIKHAVLSIRLLANMVAGHVVLLGILTLAFGIQAALSPSWTITAVIAVVGSTIFSCLELFVAFLQAYIFTFLSALFIGSAVHHH